MSGNSTRLVVRGNVRDYLNEPNPYPKGFFTNAQLDKWINKALAKYRGMWMRLQPQDGNCYEDFTYTASVEYYDITVVEGDPWRLYYLEDRTNNQPGYRIPWANSKEQLLHNYDMTGANLTGGTATLAWFEYVDSVASGVFTKALRVYLAPMPGSARSLRLHFQLAAEDMASDTYTTGLPACVEDCIELEAVLRARGVQEGVPPSTIAKTESLLAEAKKEMKAFGRPLQRGPDRVRFNINTIT